MDRRTSSADADVESNEVNGATTSDEVCGCGCMDATATATYRGAPASFVHRQLLLDDYYDATLKQRVELHDRAAVPTTASFRRLLRVLGLVSAETDASSSATNPPKWRVTTSGGAALVEGAVASIYRATYEHARFQWHRLAHLQLAAARYTDAPTEEQAMMHAWLHEPSYLRVEHPWQLSFDALGIEALRDIAPLPIRWLGWYVRRRLAQDRADREDWTDELPQLIAAASARCVAAACGAVATPPVRYRL
jgi:hypothetical protein